MAAKMSVLGLILSSYPYPKSAMVRFPVCHLSLVIPGLSLAIPGVSLLILGLFLLVLGQFQDVPDSSCLTFNEQYINSYNKLNLFGTMI